MIYEYKCESCSTVDEISMKMTDIHPKSLKCSKCGCLSFRYFHVSAVIPEHMKAGADGFNYEKRSTVHGKRYY